MLWRVEAYKAEKSPAKADTGDNGKILLCREAQELKASYIIRLKYILCKVVSEINFLH